MVFGKSLFIMKKQKEKSTKWDYFFGGLAIGVLISFIIELLIYKFILL